MCSNYPNAHAPIERCVCVGVGQPVWWKPAGPAVTDSSFCRLSSPRPRLSLLDSLFFFSPLCRSMFLMLLTPPPCPSITRYFCSYPSRLTHSFSSNFGSLSLIPNVYLHSTVFHPTVSHSLSHPTISHSQFGPTVSFPLRHSTLFSKRPIGVCLCRGVRAQKKKEKERVGGREMQAAEHCFSSGWEELFS